MHLLNKFQYGSYAERCLYCLFLESTPLAAQLDGVENFNFMCMQFQCGGFE